MSEKVDPGRSLALLWGVRDRPNRGPKPGLSVGVIVLTAMRIADQEGIEALSMRRVAEELGVGTMSLYTYVPAKAELFELMVDAAIGEARLPDNTGDWRSWLERFARDSLEGYRRHPWLLRVPLSRGLMGPNQVAALESVLRSISGIGLSNGEMMAVVQLVTGYVRGVAQSVAEAVHLERTSGVTDEQWWTDVGPLHDKYIDPAEFPTLTAVYQDETWIDPFEFGLRRLLDGVEAYLRERA